MKGLLSCTFRKGSVTKHSKMSRNIKSLECDKCKNTGPLKCYVHASLSTIQKSYGRADMKIVSFSVEGDCGILGNALLNQLKGMLGSIFVDTLKGLFGGVGEEKPIGYIDFTGTTDLWIAIFECGPEYCPKTKPPTPIPSFRKPQPPVPGPIMPGMLVRGDSNSIWQ